MKGTSRIVTVHGSQGAREAGLSQFRCRMNLKEVLEVLVAGAMVVLGEVRCDGVA